MQTMTTPLAFNHVGMTVPDIDRAIQWYGVVLGFRLIFRRLLEHRPDVRKIALHQQVRAPNRFNLKAIAP